MTFSGISTETYGSKKYSSNLSYSSNMYNSNSSNMQHGQRIILMLVLNLVGYIHSLTVAGAPNSAKFRGGVAEGHPSFDKGGLQ